ncbi:MAG: hypothetical protein IPP62_05435 [bacterium]|jgi:hypothetical protein|nr:hypothetical protein [bacterium]
MNVTAGARAFLAGLIDYAGLFPPAALPLEPALAEYARHRDGPDAWMLGRFIVPAARLEALAAALAADPFLAGRRPWSLAVLAGGSGDLAAAMAVLPAQADAVAACEQSGPRGLSVDGLEAPLPAGAAAATALAGAMADEGLGGRDLYLEPGPGAAIEAALDDIAAAAAEWAGKGGAFPALGVKLRCGGLAPEAFPTPERVAAVLAGCAQRGLPLKFTAGLHHPVRHRSESPPVMMHGFLNVVGAALLANAGDAEAGVLAACLSEIDVAAFRLDGDGFAWGGHRLDAAAVAKARTARVSGFGSCSFEEPRQDLISLGMLPPNS